MRIVEPSISLLWITANPEIMIENAGRTCYKSEDKTTDFSAGEFVRRMRDLGHHAMLEHASASFRIITDRSISHEIVRHRLASYAQESTRYCNYSKNKFGKECSFIEPPDLTANQKALWLIACQGVERFYFDLLEEGCTPQIARSVLPNCLKTEIIMTANFREWRHFIKLRTSKKAHPQIRPLASQIHNFLFTYAPNVFARVENLSA